MSTLRTHALAASLLAAMMGVAAPATVGNPLDDPGRAAFCAIQDHSCFGADFRVAKQEKGGSTGKGSRAAPDGHLKRQTTRRREMQMRGEADARLVFG